MSELRAAHEEFAEILEELGVQIGEEVLDLWSDRMVHGYEPLPYDALVRLAMWSTRMTDKARARSQGVMGG